MDVYRNILESVLRDVVSLAQYVWALYISKIGLKNTLKSNNPIKFFRLKKEKRELIFPYLTVIFMVLIEDL